MNELWHGTSVTASYQGKDLMVRRVDTGRKDGPGLAQRAAGPRQARHTPTPPWMCAWCQGAYRGCDCPAAD